MDTSCGVDLADGQVDGGLLGDEDVRLVVRLSSHDDHEPEQKLVVRTNRRKLRKRFNF